jgi:hypothetical protein
MPQTFGGRVPAVGPGGGKHQLRPDPVQDLPADAQSFQDALREILDHDVGLPDQLEEDLLALRLLQVQPDTFLARIEQQEGLAGGLASRTPPNRLAFERLDLDHCRTE